MQPVSFSQFCQILFIAVPFFLLSCGSTSLERSNKALSKPIDFFESILSTLDYPNPIEHHISYDRSSGYVTISEAERVRGVFQEPNSIIRACSPGQTKLINCLLDDISSAPHASNYSDGFSAPIVADSIAMKLIFHADQTEESVDIEQIESAQLPENLRSLCLLCAQRNFF